MGKWENFIITAASAILSGVVIYVIQLFIKREKGVSLKRSAAVALIVVVVVAGVVWLVLSQTNPADEVSSSLPAGATSSRETARNMVLEFAGAAQTRTHNAGPGHKTSASVLVKRMEFAEDYTLVVVEVDNNGDSDLTVNTSEIQGSTALVVNGKSYPYVKHDGSAIVSGTTETITFYFERCSYATGNSIALNFHLGLPLQYNMKDLQENVK